eukprot:CAMPEP_0197885556 /NCGR_PEP_ID=MMETSP1439-20131203/13786_1 /TAXON_ID=66791 /ORGANISM="Gonyaulax spinifera, Strain CCMP409" /LENGTH=55 /DNA_ID=CAMNT_0043505311 /DNA_START=32 /DNA_END=196 /DNA_ORIENTATION=+
MRFFARPVNAFFFSALATLGVWFLTLPARAKLPWTLPIAPVRCLAFRAAAESGLE